jgi:hypothetical protein
MERFKTPAGRLATIYYNGAVDLARQTDQARVPSDEEKAQTTGTDSNEVRLIDSRSQQTREQVISRSQRRFSWKNICLDIEVDGQTNRLLHNISGETRHPTRVHRFLGYTADNTAQVGLSQAR